MNIFLNPSQTDTILYSFEIGISKNNRMYFKILMKEYDLDVSQTR